MRALVLSLLLVAAACGGSATPSAAPSPSPSSSSSSAPADHVDGAQARELVKSGAQLVDVRSADEYASKHIEGAINVPADTLASHDFGGKDKPLVLYCAAGHRSEKAAETLRASGYTRVYVLGPMSAWGE